MDSESFVADVKRKILASNAWAFELRKIRMENEDLKTQIKNLGKLFDGTCEREKLLGILRSEAEGAKQQLNDRTQEINELKGKLNLFRTVEESLIFRLSQCQSELKTEKEKNEALGHENNTLKAKVSNLTEQSVDSVHEDLVYKDLGVPERKSLKRKRKISFSCVTEEIVIDKIIDLSDEDKNKERQFVSPPSNMLPKQPIALKPTRITKRQLNEMIRDQAEIPKRNWNRSSLGNSGDLPFTTSTPLTSPTDSEESTPKKNHLSVKEILDHMNLSSPVSPIPASPRRLDSPVPLLVDSFSTAPSVEALLMVMSPALSQDSENEIEKFEIESSDHDDLPHLSLVLTDAMEEYKEQYEAQPDPFDQMKLELNWSEADEPQSPVLFEGNENSDVDSDVDESYSSESGFDIIYEALGAHKSNENRKKRTDFFPFAGSHRVMEDIEAKTIQCLAKSMRQSSQLVNSCSSASLKKTEIKVVKEPSISAGNAKTEASKSHLNSSESDDAKPSCSGKIHKIVRRLRGRIIRKPHQISTKKCQLPKKKLVVKFQRKKKISVELSPGFGRRTDPNRLKK